MQSRRGKIKSGREFSRPDDGDARPVGFELISATNLTGFFHRLIDNSIDPCSTQQATVSAQSHFHPAWRCIGIDSNAPLICDQGGVVFAGMCGNRTHPRRNRLTTDLKSAGATRLPCIPVKKIRKRRLEVKQIIELRNSPLLLCSKSSPIYCLKANTYWSNTSKV